MPKRKDFLSPRVMMTFTFIWSEMKVAQLCPTLCDSLYSPWNSPGQNTGVGSCSLPQGLLPLQGLNSSLPYFRWILYQLSHQGSFWVFVFIVPSSCELQFSSVAQSCPTVCDHMNRSTPGLPVHHQLPESTQTHVHWVGDAIQPSHPLSSPSPPALNLSQHQGLFK